MSENYEEKLRKMGIDLPTAPAPAANYVPWVKVGNMLYVSGQISADKNGLITGKLGEGVDIERGKYAARACAISLFAQVKAGCEGDLDRLERVIKLTGFVNSTPDFTEQPEIINGASDLFAEILGTRGHHSRVAISASALPRGVVVEIDGIFLLKP